jgi:polysaccharide pyruvyl transferase WcaK-like protein
VTSAASADCYFLYGYYGQGNLGDDLLLRATVEGIRALRPSATFIVRSATTTPNWGSPGGVEATGIDRIATDQSRSKLARLIATLRAYSHYFRRSSWFIFGGGTVFHERESPFPLVMLALICLLARLRGLRVAALGVGVAELRSPLGRLALRAIVTVSDLFAVRDESARRQCELAGVGEMVRLTGDLVFGLSALRPCGPANVAESRGPRVALSVSPGALTGAAGERAVLVLREFLGHMVANGYRVTMFSFQESGALSDREVLARLAAAIHPDHADDVVWRKLSFDPEEIVRSFAGIDLHCGMRFHGHVLAAMLGRPFVGISHDKKIEEICRLFGMPSVAMEQMAAGELLAAVETAKGSYPDPQRLMTCTSQAALNFSLFNSAMIKRAAAA